MSEQITYGSYSFPDPTPFLGQGIEPVYIAGEIDHTRNSIELVGSLTGENLSGLHLQKMQMISGMMPTFQTLTISHETEDKTFLQVKPENISFSDSDLTTVLPYSVSFSCYESDTFSEFFGVSDPKDTWSFNEQDGRIIESTHNVSAKGVKVDSASPLVNARNFVTERVGGYQDLSLFLTGSTGYLISRTEDIDKSKNTYGLQETYRYNTSEYISTGLSGVFQSNCSIAYGKDEGLNVSVDASIQGNFDAIKNSEGIISTGLFTASMAQEIAINSVVSSLSNYESGLYTFIDRGPSSASYNIDTGTNIISFSYVFSNPENLDQVGNVLHTRKSTVSASKDDSKVRVSIQGDFEYNSPFEIIPSGDPATGQRFTEIDEQYSGIATGSGFLNLAIEALQDFTGYAVGYHISGNYINPEPLSRSISKDPNQSSISYSVSFDNGPDLSDGSLTGLEISLTDKKPLELSGIIPSLGGFAKQKINNRTAGEFSATASCEASAEKSQELKNIVDKHMTGIFVFSESNSLNDKSISYNTSRYY